MSEGFINPLEGDTVGPLAAAATEVNVALEQTEFNRDTDITTEIHRRYMEKLFTPQGNGEQQ